MGSNVFPHAAEQTWGTEVPLQSALSASTLLSSLPPPPLPHISTFQHTDTVTARTDFHSEAHGQWTGRPAAGNMPPCESHIAAQWQTGITAEAVLWCGTCFRPSGAFMLTENIQAVCVIFEFFSVKKHALLSISVCVLSLAFKEGVQSTQC